MLVAVNADLTYLREPCVDAAIDELVKRMPKVGLQLSTSEFYRSQRGGSIIRVDEDAVHGVSPIPTSSSRQTTAVSCILTAHDLFYGVQQRRYFIRIGFEGVLSTYTVIFLMA